MKASLQIAGKNAALISTSGTRTEAAELFEWRIRCRVTNRLRGELACKQDIRRSLRLRVLN